MKAYMTPNVQSLKAGADLSALQYHFVKAGTVENEVIAISAATDIPIGILMNAPESGESVELAMIGGGAKLKVGSGISAGSFIGTDATGLGTSVAADSGKWVGAIADAISSSTTSANDIVPVIPVGFYANSEASEAGSIGFVAAAGGANVSEVTLTVKDGSGATLAGVHQLIVWLSDAATGLGLTGTTASGTVTAKAASGEVFGTLTAKKALIVQTLADGTFVLEITDSAKSAFYVSAMPYSSGATNVSAVLATGDYGA